MVERLFVAQKVVGSIPIGHPMTIETTRILARLFDLHPAIDYDMLIAVIYCNRMEGAMKRIDRLFDFLVEEKPLSNDPFCRLSNTGSVICLLIIGLLVLQLARH